MSDTGVSGYIERADNQALAQPLALSRATLYLFPVEADVGRQQALCDRFLNRPSFGVCDYRAFLPRVVFCFARLGVARAQSEPDAERGFFSFTMAGVWVPAVSTRGARPVVFPYYTFVDESHALVTGREVWGFPMELASMEVPRDAAAAHVFRVAPVLLDRFGPRTLARAEQLFQITKVPGTSRALFGEVWEDTKAAIAGASNLLFGGPRIAVPDAGVLLDVAQSISSGLTFALLKQFRDAERPERACYQAGVEARAATQHFHRAGVLDGRFALNLKVADSHPMVEEMGLAAKSFDHLVGLFVDLDVVVESGVELWHAP
ncbi:acetoacetate decarboxylase family protein [Polyangium sp. 6x1]|uniref:acetoacetate decarboxylase family protein n=1 Tax=Polyangium sp. 6x1 TaxID=3042689 RepID=UPI0024826975|nr:acetoacetate decarboxylase family protein [Polyangium sp. 6x1]MDI1442609.1 acetoacetate decarboxylase family protein [Polyangium sp. 6x1]